MRQEVEVDPSVCCMEVRMECGCVMMGCVGGRVSLKCAVSCGGVHLSYGSDRVIIRCTPGQGGVSGPIRVRLVYAYEIPTTMRRALRHALSGGGRLAWGDSLLIRQL